MKLGGTVLTARSTYFLAKLGKRILYSFVFLIALWSLSHVFVFALGWLPQRYMIPVSFGAGVVFIAFHLIGGPGGMGPDSGIESRWWRLAYAGIPILGVAYFTPWKLLAEDGTTMHRVYEPFWQIAHIGFLVDCSAWHCRDVPVVAAADWVSILLVAAGAIVMTLALVAHWEQAEIRELRYKYRKELKNAEKELRFRLAAPDLYHQRDKTEND